MKCNPFPMQATSTRIVAACAAVVTTTLLIASQLGLAEHYESEATMAQAARQAAPSAQGIAAAVAPRPWS